MSENEKSEKFTEEERKTGEKLSKELSHQLQLVMQEFSDEFVEKIDGQLLSEVMMNGAKTVLLTTMLDTVKPEYVEEVVNGLAKQIIEKFGFVWEYRQKADRLKEEMMDKAKSIWQ